MSTVRTASPCAERLAASAAVLFAVCLVGADAAPQVVDPAVPPAGQIGSETSEPAPVLTELADGTAVPLDPSEPAAPPPPITRFETEIEFKRLVEEERFTEALPLAPQLIELTSQEFGARSVETARAYQQVADAQRLAGEHDSATENYLKAVEVYRAADGPFTPLAIEPLTGLGDNYQDARDYLSAVSAYGEARTVTRRSFGLLTERQIPLLDRLTISLASMNQYVEAEKQQLEALRIMERNYEPHSAEALAAIYKYAGWLRENGRFQEERDQYMRALRIIRDHYGKDSPAQVRPMLGIGNSFRNQRIPDGQGVSNLREALALLLAQKDPDELAIAEVLRDLGDWEIAFNKVGYDGAEYRRAWQLLGNVPDGESLRRAWFNGPIYVLREPISQRGLSQDADALPGHVVVKFDLDALGRTTNVVIVESDPPGLKDESVLRHVRRSRFRPQMANGELVPGTGLAMQFNYRYTPDETLTENGAKGERD